MNDVFFLEWAASAVAGIGLLLFMLGIAGCSIIACLFIFNDGRPNPRHVVLASVSTIICFTLTALLPTSQSLLNRAKDITKQINCGLETKQ